MSFFKNIISSI